jgi:predicted nucleic-acid-binding protein
MIAVDTNIVVRYVTDDHPQQSARARALVRTNEVFLSKTVVLECEWVLRSLYGYSPQDVNMALRAFLGIPTVSVENPGFVAQALDLAEQGLDFADALHLTAATDCESFATFDRNFAKRAKHAGFGKVTSP